MRGLWSQRRKVSAQIPDQLYKFLLVLVDKTSKARFYYLAKQEVKCKILSVGFLSQMSFRCVRAYQI